MLIDRQARNQVAISILLCLTKLRPYINGHNDAAKKQKVYTVRWEYESTFGLIVSLEPQIGRLDSPVLPRYPQMQPRRSQTWPIPVKK